MSKKIFIRCEFCGYQLSIPNSSMIKGRCSKCKKIMDIPNEYRYNFWLSKCAIFLTLLYIFIAISIRLTESSGGWFPNLMSALATYPGAFALDRLGFEIKDALVFTFAIFITASIVFCLGSCLEYFFCKIKIMFRQK